MVPAAFGAAIASDSASDAAYNDGWDAGDNGGSGLGPWVFTNIPGSGSAGQFQFNSTANADGLDDGTIGGVTSDGDIDTPILTGGSRSWGMFANGGGRAIADRPLTGGELAIGQSVSIDMDNGYIDSGRVGVYFGDGGGDGIGVYFQGGDTNYSVVVGVAGTYVMTPTTLGFADEGLSVTLTRTGTDSGNLTITLRNGDSDTISTGFFMLDPVNTISVVNDNAGFGDSRNAYFNSIVVTPEPTSAVLLGVGALMLARRRRRGSGSPRR